MSSQERELRLLSLKGELTRGARSRPQLMISIVELKGEATRAEDFDSAGVRADDSAHLASPQISGCQRSQILWGGIP